MISRGLRDMLIWCLVLFMQDDGGLSLQISTERLLFLLG